MGREQTEVLSMGLGAILARVGCSMRNASRVAVELSSPCSHPLEPPRLLAVSEIPFHTHWRVSRLSEPLETSGGLKSQPWGSSWPLALESASPRWTSLHLPGGSPVTLLYCFAFSDRAGFLWACVRLRVSRHLPRSPPLHVNETVRGASPDAIFGPAIRTRPLRNGP